MPMMLRMALILLVAGACGGETESSETDSAVALLRPGSFTETAPAEFNAHFETSRGTFTVAVHRQWAPNGADRFFNLVKAGFYDDIRVFRVVPDFMVSFGLHGHPRVTEAWERRSIVDDEVVVSNTRGRISFAHHGPNTRTTTVFINVDDNPAMDDEGFAPFGEVVEGMDVVESFHAGYGDAPPRGEGPVQAHIRTYGNAYLDRDFPDLDAVIRATVIPEN